MIIITHHTHYLVNTSSGLSKGSRERDGRDHCTSGGIRVQTNMDGTRAEFAFVMFRESHYCVLGNNGGREKEREVREKKLRRLSKSWCSVFMVK